VPKTDCESDGQAEEEHDDEQREENHGFAACAVAFASSTIKEETKSKHDWHIS
jgi:hypothetical protein